MRIRTHILSWIFLSTVVPLTAVAFAAIYFIEREYYQRAHEEISTSLNNIAADLQRHLELQRQLASGVATSAAVQDYLDALQVTQFERVDSRYHIQWGRVNHYFEGFQTIVQGAYRMRILDTHGNTLVKVSDQRRSPPLFANFSSMYYVEPELDDRQFHKTLTHIVANEVSNLLLPRHQRDSDAAQVLALYDYVVPLRVKKKLIGAFSLTLFGEDLDRVMNYLPRLYNAKLFIVENNPDHPSRHGMILYDDERAVQFSQPREAPMRAQTVYGEDNFAQLITGPYGVFIDQQHEQNIFHVELFPYPNQLLSWEIGARVPTRQLEQPFVKARRIVLIVGGLAVLIGLFVAPFGAQRIAQPLHALSQHLLAFARGEHTQRAKTDSHVNEVRDLELAFNSMADSLDTAAAERDKAQQQMLQNAKLASIGQLAAGIGHELNNPLNNILSYAKLIERGLPDEAKELREDMLSLKGEAQRASQIIQGILNFARQVPPQFAAFQALAWLQDTLALVKQSAINAGVTLAYECVEDFEIYGDRGQLQQVLINLLINAIGASARHDQVLVRVQHDPVEVRISVVDQGSGIRPEFLSKVFDPFFTTKTEGGGSGLGLSISYGIIERHGGELVIYNNLDRGVTAVIRIPKEKTHASE